MANTLFTTSGKYCLLKRLWSHDFFFFHISVLYFSSDSVISFQSSHATGRGKVVGLGDV